MICNINGIEIYYEIIGKGSPIILLHGNGETHEIFDKLSEELCKTNTVYCIDSRCHGKSSNTKEISYNLMANDIVEFIKSLNINKPILYGFSDGGIIGLLIAINYPDLLDKLIISGANITPSGLDFKSQIENIIGMIKGNKLYRLMVKEPHIKPKELKKIKTKTIILAGENDVIKRKHTEKIAKNISNSILEIIPNETHDSYIIHNTKIYHILNKYL